MPHRRRANWFCFLFSVLIFTSLRLPARAEETPPPAEPSEKEAQKETLNKLKRTPFGPVVKWLFNEKRKYFVLPVVSSGPDTGWLGGIAWYQTDIFGKDKRDLVLGAITTQSGQDNFMFS